MMTIERLFFMSMGLGWIAAVSAVAINQPEHVLLFGRVFVATCIGVAHTVGL